MIRIAVVGEIGSGKTYIARLFGLPVFNADNEVADIYKKDKTAYRKLRLKLPKYISSFPVSKTDIGNAIKNNINNIKKINKIIHPIVRKRMRNFLKKNNKKKAVVLDIPLYFENNLNRKKDIVIFISSKKNHINDALKKRKKSNIKLLKKLNSLQKSLVIKRKKSNYIIQNNFKSRIIRKKVNIIKKQILANEGNNFRY